MSKLATVLELGDGKNINPVYCTACHRGPCIIGYLAKTEPLPDQYIVSGPFEQSLPSGCELPEYMPE